jgi:hypothetical protein
LLYFLIGQICPQMHIFNVYANIVNNVEHAAIEDYTNNVHYV